MLHGVTALHQFSDGNISRVISIFRVPTVQRASTDEHVRRNMGPMRCQTIISANKKLEDEESTWGVALDLVRGCRPKVDFD